MERQTEKKTWAFWALLFILAMQTAVILWFGSQKQGYFIDEIYSFGLSNGYYKPFITSYGDEIFDQWAGRAVIDDYMTVQEGERFAYGSVVYNQSQDVHPPVFYLLLHTVSSFFPGIYSKWFGIAINLACFLLSCVFLWLSARRILKSQWLALIPVVIWGFSAGAVSYTIYIRMYMVMTLFTVLSVYFHEKMVRLHQRPKELVMLYFATICGILTQYYFVIFAFFLSAAYCLWKMLKKAWKEAFIYGAVMFGSVGSAVLLFPACITQLTRPDEVVAQETRKNIGNLNTFVTNLKSYGYGIHSDFLSGLYLAAFFLVFLAAVAVLCAVFYRAYSKENGKREEDRCGRKEREHDDPAVAAMGVLSFGWIGAVLTISAVAVVPSPRYICSLYPLMVLTGVWILRRLWGELLVAADVCLAGIAILFLGLSVLSYQRGFVQYLYPDEPARLAVAEQYDDTPCLYVTNYRMAALTQDLRTLSCYKEFYVTSQENLKNIESILTKGSVGNRLIVTVDNNSFWGSGYDGEEVVREICGPTGFTVKECLFAPELSVTYLLERQDHGNGE